MMSLRFQRSIKAPTGRLKSRKGRRCMLEMNPVWAGELVSARMSKGRAKVEICVPSRERAWPPQSKTKSRLRHNCEEDSLCKRFCLHIGVEIAKLSNTAKWHSQLHFLL